MNNLNPELLKNRMMRGALTGPAAEEKIPMRRCNGVIESGRRCSVVPLPGHEYCKVCEVKEARGEMPALAVTKMPVEPLRAHNLKPKKAKTVISDNLGTAGPLHLSETAQPVAVAVFADPLHFCIAGMLDHACGAPAVMGTQSTTDWDEVTCENCLVWKPVTAPQEACAVYGCPVAPLDGSEFCWGHQSDHCHTNQTAGAGKEIELQDCGCGMGNDCMRSTEVETTPTAAALPNEPAEPLPVPSSPLFRLLTAAVPPPPPLPPCSLVVTLDAYRYAALTEMEITPDDVAQLVTYLLDGELQRVSRAAG